MPSLRKSSSALVLLFSFWLLAISPSLLAQAALAEVLSEGLVSALVEKPAAEQRREAVAVITWGRSLVHYRVKLEFSSVEERAQAAANRIDEALGQINPDSIIVQPLRRGDSRGVMLSAGTRFLLSIMEADLSPEEGTDLAAVAQRVRGSIASLSRDYAAQHSLSLVLRSLAQSGVASLALLLAILLLSWLKRRAFRFLTYFTTSRRHEFRGFGYDWGAVLHGALTTTLRLLFIVGFFCVTYGWLTFVLGRFPYTEPLAGRLGSYLWTILAQLATQALGQVPNLIALCIIYLVMRGLIRVLNGWFEAVESGRYAITWLDPEAARASRRLANIGVWIIALIICFPYLPGSHSEAFRGICVFLGLMLSIGGAGFTGQIIGGLTAVYSRAVRRGDYIRVDAVEGTVKELGMFSTKVMTRTGEEVTVPNAVLISSAVINFSRLEGHLTLITTSITVGYDTPWRQVEAMILTSVARTQGLLASPPPRVLQAQLDDFYAKYEIIACSQSAQGRSELIDRLHGNIQDVFRENGILMTSPHYVIEPSASLPVSSPAADKRQST